MPLPLNRSLSQTLSLFSVIILFYAPLPAHSLEVDLDNHHLAVTTGFVGTQVLLFGAVSDVGTLVIKVTGPPQKATIRKKERVLGVWANTEKVEFEAIPSFYYYAAAKIPNLLPAARHHTDLDTETYRREKIEVQDLTFRFADDQQDLSKPRQYEYEQALIKLKKDQGLYPTMQGKITFIGQELFRMALTFPSTVPIGTYKLEVLHVQNGTTIHAKTTPLIVSKEGIGADISYFAHRHSLLYGISAIIIAIFAGWIAAAVFGRR